jgi:hypothetical protein
MIKLSELLNDPYLYHGTTDGAGHAIQRSGGMKINAAGNAEPFISFTAKMRVAKYYANIKGGSRGIILRTPKTNDFRLSDKFVKNDGYEWITDKEIPLDKLEIQTKNGWVPLKNWDFVDKKVITNESGAHQSAVSFKNHDQTMILTDANGEKVEVSIYPFTHNSQNKFNWRADFGNNIQLGTSSTNLEQVYADLARFLKEKGLPYTQVSKIKLTVVDAESKQKLIQQLQQVAADFRNAPPDPNKPVGFGKGPPAFGQWVSSTDVKSGLLEKTIERYGDFWLVIKWSFSARQTIKASELAKNYERMMHGKNAKNEFAREIFVRDKPFDDL